MQTGNNLDLNYLDSWLEKLDANQLDEAIAKLLDLAKPHANDPRVFQALGDAYSRQGDYKNSLKNYKTALGIDSSNLKALIGAGTSSARLGLDGDALQYYDRALDKMPDNTALLYNKATIELRQGNVEESENLYRRILSTDNTHFHAWNNLGLILYDKGENEEALSCFQKAVGLNNQVAEIHRNLGILLNDLGDKSQAKLCMENALRLKPGFTSAHQSLSELKTYQPGDPQIQAMNTLVLDETTTPDGKAELHFALFKAHQDMGEFTTAFRHLVNANALRNSLLDYDIDQEKRLFSHIPKAYEKLLKANLVIAPEHAVKKIPIFLVSMPRSGSTLLEQIIASHPEVYPAGELGFMSHAISKSRILDSPASQDNLLKLREIYLAQLQQIDCGTGMIVDKAPANFRWLGFIKAAIPEAKVLCISRDPMAVCYSIYKHDFAQQGHAYAFDQENIVAYYKLYKELMGYWSEKLNNWYHELSYELLTAAPEEKMIEVFNFLNLEWDSKYLEFYQAKRVVKTASTGQVREKIYTGSSNDWRRYEQQLTKLAEGLKDFRS